MTRALIIALACASPAFAGDTANWGGTGCKLTPVHGQAHVAEITCRNVLTIGLMFTEGVMQIDALAVSVSIDHAPDALPDTFTLIPSPGYTVQPGIMVLDENQRGKALVFPYSGS